jgi:hypothetical protein
MESLTGFCFRTLAGSTRSSTSTARTLNLRKFRIPSIVVFLELVEFRSTASRLKTPLSIGRENRARHGNAPARINVSIQALLC